MKTQRSSGTPAASAVTNLDQVADTLNDLIARRRPVTLNSSWIKRNAPACYRFIRKRIRNAVGTVDWDQVTYCLGSEYQSRWDPGPRRRRSAHAHSEEVALILNRYRDKLYVFIAAPDCTDELIRDEISIALVRAAQTGNCLAGEELMKLVGYTVDEWLESHPFLSRWRGHEEELKEEVAGCVRRYRYTGSFIRFLHATLAYAARGIQPSISLPHEEALFRFSIRGTEKVQRI